MERLGIRIDDVKIWHRRIFLLACAVLAAHCLAMVSKYGFGRDHVLGLVPMFDFYEENNIPTYFSSINLLVTAAMLYAIAELVARTSRKLAVPWRVLSFGFLFMSIDEFCDARMIISTISKSVMSSQNITSLPYFSVAWTIPITAIVILLAFYFIPFLLKLRKVYLVNFAVAGALFVFATLGLETVEGFHTVQTKGVRDFTFMLYVTLEETLEIFSIVYFQYYLIKYMNENFADREARIQRAA
jgi:hypothetical protein